MKTPYKPDLAAKRSANLLRVEQDAKQLQERAFDEWGVVHAGAVLKRAAELVTGEVPTPELKPKPEPQEKPKAAKHAGGRPKKPTDLELILQLHVACVGKAEGKRLSPKEINEIVDGLFRQPTRLDPKAVRVLDELIDRLAGPATDTMIETKKILHRRSDFSGIKKASLKRKIKREWKRIETQPPAKLEPIPIGAFAEWSPD